MNNRELNKIVKNILKEAPIDYDGRPERMDPKVVRKIEDPEGIFAKNRAFKGGVSDVEKITSKRFGEIVDYVRRYFNSEENVTDPYYKSQLQREMMNSLRQVMMIEASHKDALKDLAFEIGSKEEGWIPYSKTLDDLVNDGVISKHPINGGGTKYELEFFDVECFLNESKINPNSFKIKSDEIKKLPIPNNFSFDLDELTPEEIRQLEIEKRHVINSLVQGRGKRGQFAYQGYKDRLDEIDPRLYALYNKIMGYNDLMYFTDQDLIDMLGGNAAGMTKIESNDDEDEDGEDGKDTIIANGLIFPILLHELVKGYASVTAREQWRDMDPDLAHDVIGQTDTMENEPMHFRVGGELSRKLKMLLPDELTLDLDGRKYLPFFERLLYSIPAERFLREVIANVVSDRNEDNDKARKIFDELLQQAKEEYDQL